MNKPVNMSEADFAKAMGYAKQHDRTAYNFILCVVLKDRAEKGGPASLCGAIWDGVSSLSRNEYKRIIKRGRELQHMAPALSSDIDKVVGFVRTHLITAHA